MSDLQQYRPTLATSWKTDVLDVGVIQDELNRLWHELNATAHLNIPTADAGDAPPSTPPGTVRANTLNLVAVARNERDIRLIETTVAHLQDYLPSRTIIIMMKESIGEGDETSRYEIGAELLTQYSAQEEPGLRFETVRIAAPLQEVESVVSAVEPLFMADLPDVLWWPSGDFSPGILFEELLDQVSHAIFDSAQLGNDIRRMDEIRRILDAPPPVPNISDFTWGRLAPWRQLIAQFFDPSETQACLSTVERLNIAYAENRKDGSSGLPAAMLMVGWLATRLGWQVDSTLERRKAGGWSATFRTTSGSRNRDIHLRLTPDRSSGARFSLRSVELRSVEPARGIFKVERTDADDLITTSETSDVPAVSRMVYSRRPDNETMLGNELKRFGQDRIYAEALRFATRLLNP